MRMSGWTVVDGFTIRNAGFIDGAVTATGGDPTIRNCVITGESLGSIKALYRRH